MSASARVLQIVVIITPSRCTKPTAKYVHEYMDQPVVESFTSSSVSYVTDPRQLEAPSVIANRITAVIGRGSLRSSFVVRGSSPEEGYVIVGFRVLRPGDIRLRGEARKEEPWLLTPTECAARLNVSRAFLYKILDTPFGPGPSRSGVAGASLRAICCSGWRSS